MISAVETPLEPNQLPHALGPGHEDIVLVLDAPSVKAVDHQGRRPPLIHDLQRDRGGIWDNDRPDREPERGDGDHLDHLQPRVQDTSTSGHGIAGGPGRG